MVLSIDNTSLAEESHDTLVEPSSSSLPPEPPGLSGGGDSINADNEPIVRTRYLRACDRCRSRKVKCDTQDPCARCRIKNVPCTFNPPAAGTFVMPIKKDKEKEKESASVGGTKRKRSATAATPTPSGPSQMSRDARAKLDAEKVTPENTHWYTSHPGTFRIVGTTSGLPILDSARQLLSIRGNAPPSSGSTWDYLNSLMQGKTEDETANAEAINNETLDAAEVDGTENGARNLEEAFNIYGEVAAKIPGDLLASLLDLFFRLIHPSWPILHADRFFNDTGQWNDPSHGAMVVAMCMLASRYSSDPRVLSPGGDPSTAGTQWHHLFHKLLGTVHRGTFKDCLALFFVSQFYCVNKVPSPLSFHYFSACAAYCIDFGLNREYPAKVPLDPVEREIRRRAGWAIFCYNMQISAIFGRQQWFTLQIWDNRIPSPFTETADSTSLPILMDTQHVMIFNEMIRISAVLDITLWAVVHRPLFADSPFLAKIAFKTDPLPQDEEGMKQAEESLNEWRESLPPELRQRDISDRPKSPFFSIASEQIAGIETLIEILLAARRLQLTLATRPLDPDKESALRGPLVQAAKSMITSMIQLGPADLIHQADMLFAYRCLVASRLLLAALLSAKSQRDWQTEAECHRALQATAMLLDIFATRFPASRWATKTFENTCKVCGVVLTHAGSNQAVSASGISSASGQGIFSTMADSTSTMTRIFEDSPVDALDPGALDIFSTFGINSVNPTSLLSNPVQEAPTMIGAHPLDQSIPAPSFNFDTEGVPQPDVDISWLFPGIPLWSDSG